MNAEKSYYTNGGVKELLYKWTEFKDGSDTGFISSSFKKITYNEFLKIMQI